MAESCAYELLCCRHHHLIVQVTSRSQVHYKRNKEKGRKERVVYRGRTSRHATMRTVVIEGGGERGPRKRRKEEKRDKSDVAAAASDCCEGGGTTTTTCIYIYSTERVIDEGFPLPSLSHDPHRLRTTVVDEVVVVVLLKQQQQ